MFNKTINKNDKLKISLLNSISSGIDYFVRLIVSFLVSPILIQGVGAVTYGIWKTLLQTIGYIGTVDGRPSSALKWIIANQQYKDDHDKKNSAINSSILVYLFFVPLLIIFSSIYIIFLPNLLDIPLGQEVTFQIIAILLVLKVVMDGFAGIPDAILRGMNLGYKQMGILASILILTGITKVGIVKFGGGIIAIAASEAFYSFVLIVIYSKLVKSLLSWIKIKLPSKGEIKKFLSYSLPLMLTDVIKKFNNTADLLLLGLILSPFIVTQYVSSNFIIQMPIVLATIIISGSLPSLGGYLGLDQKEKVYQIRKQIMILGWFLTTTLGVITFLFNESFVSLWVGREFYVGDFPTVLMVLASIQLMLIRIDENFIDISLNVNKKIFFGSLSIILLIILSIVLGNQCGLSGFLLGIIIGRSVISLAYPQIISKFLKPSNKLEILSLLRPLILTVFVFLFIYLFKSNFLISNWFVLVGAVLLATIIIIPIFWYLGINKEYRSQIWSLLETYLKKISKRNN